MATRKLSLSRAQDVAGLIKDIVETLAVLVAAGWFLVQGLERPRLKIEHKITHRALADGSNKVHIVADVFMSNIGNVELNIPCGKITVRQILPGPAPGRSGSGSYLSYDSCSLKNYIIESGEGDQYQFSLDVDDKVRAIQFDTFIPNPLRKGRGWGLQSFYDLSSPAPSRNSFPDATPAEVQSPLSGLTR